MSTKDYFQRKESGICVYSTCQLPSHEGRVYCKAHWAERRAYDKARWHRDKTKRTANHDKWVKEQKPKLVKFNKAYRHRVRAEVIAKYGGFCKCCGETDLVFLDIDHINNDGGKHRRETGLIGLSLYLWLRRKDFPEGFQILCKNCNWAKHILGKCPHERTLISATGS